MIMNTEHLENGFEDEHFKFVIEVDFIELIERLKNDGYNILTCAEKYYYDEIKDLSLTHDKSKIQIENTHLTEAKRLYVKSVSVSYR